MYVVIANQLFLYLTLQCLLDKEQRYAYNWQNESSRADDVHLIVIYPVQFVLLFLPWSVSIEGKWVTPWSDRELLLPYCNGQIHY